MAKRGVPALADLKTDSILAHIIDPDNNPLPAKLDAEFQRVLGVARMLDDYPNESHIMRLHCAKYRVSKSQARTDIAHAKELYKTQHTFDWDFCFSWMIKDQLELIRSCRLRNDFKNWNAAKKVLLEMIGEKPAAIEDPRRMEKNVIVIQANINGNVISLPLDKVRGLSAADIQLLQESMQQPITEVEAEEIFNS